MSQQKIGREVADGAVNAKQQEVAALLKKKAVADGVVETAAADSVFASDASVMVAATGTTTGLFAGVSTGTLIAGGIGLVALGVLAAEAGDDDNDGAAPAPAPGVSPGPSPGVTPAPTPGPGNSGNTGPNSLTYTLTNQTDNLLGTSAAESFIGDGNTTGAGDTLNGAGGTDIFKGFNTIVLPNISAIENLYYFAPQTAAGVATQNISITTKADVVQLELDTVGAAASQDGAVGGAAGDVTLAQGQSLILSNTGFAAGFVTDVAGTMTSQNITVNNYGLVNNNALNGAAATVDSTIALLGTSLTTLNLTTATKDSYVNLTNPGAVLTTLNIAGDKNLDIELNTAAGIATLTTIDASKATGSVDVDLGVIAGALKFTGGSANDRINMDTTLGGTDVLNGGGGTGDVLKLTKSASVVTATKVAGDLASDIIVTANDNSTAAFVQGTSNFEIIESNASLLDQILDLGALNAKNTITGLVLSDEDRTAGSLNKTQIITNINAATAGNIVITADQIGTAGAAGLTLAAAPFVAGGVSDTATITLDNSLGAFASKVGTNATGVDVLGTFLFNNVDVLNLKSVSDGTSVVAEQNSIAALRAPDLEVITITGDNTFLLATHADTKGLTQVDASGLVIPGTAGVTAGAAGAPALDLATDASALTSLLVKGTSRADQIDINNGATVTTTVFTGGGSDVVDIASAATGQNAFVFTATALNTGDVRANENVQVNIAAENLAGGTPSAALATGQILTIDFTSALEGLLKSNGVVLGTTNANVTFTTAAGASTAPLSATTNIAASQAAGVMTIQIDLNGDGAFVAADDWQFNILGSGVNDTLVYNATTDQLVFTVVA